MRRKSIHEALNCMEVNINKTSIEMVGALYGKLANLVKEHYSYLEHVEKELESANSKIIKLEKALKQARMKALKESIDD